MINPTIYNISATADTFEVRCSNPTASNLSAVADLIFGNMGTEIKHSNNYQDVIGQRFGRLVVLSEKSIKEKGSKVQCECICDCGLTAFIMKGQLKRGMTKSCGCLRRDLPFKHGMYNTREWSTWKSMRRRCNNKNNKQYYQYGGRGITVCEDWSHSFENFYRDMGNRPIGTSIDRINNDEGYSKDNCRWATRIQQQNNMRSNVIVTYKGETKTGTEFARQYGINPDTLLGRLQNTTWTLDECFSPANPHRKHKQRITKQEIEATASYN